MNNVNKITKSNSLFNMAAIKAGLERAVTPQALTKVTSTPALGLLTKF